MPVATSPAQSSQNPIKQGHCPRCLPLPKVPIFHHPLLRVPEHPGYHPSPPPTTGRGGAGSRASISALTGPQSIRRAPAPVGTARGALTDAHSYPFSPRKAPSRRPGGGIRTRPGDRGAAGPASGADGTRRRRGCALGLWEPGTARSARACPGRTRGAFAARALGSGLRPLGLCSRRAANRVGRRAGTRGPGASRRGAAAGSCSGDGRPAGSGSVAQAPSRLRSGLVSRSRSGWGRRTAEAAAARPRREAGPRAGRCALRDLLLARVQMPGVTEGGVRLALFTHRVKQYPVPAREMQTPEPRGVALRCL